MDASIAEPFHVATYSVAQRPRKSKGADKYAVPENLFATHEKIASGSSDGYVTAAAQGDGVHILDLSTLHPVISHTLGPSTTFSCPAVSVFEDRQNICATYCGIASSADVTLEEYGRTIWTWRENLSSPGDRASQKRRAAVMPHHVSGIHSCNATPPRLLVFSTAGDLTLVDEDLKIRSTVPPPPTTATVLRSFIFPRESNSFLSGHIGTTVVLLEQSQDESALIRVLAILAEDEAKTMGSCEVSVQPDQITAVSCSASGFLSILTRDGSWSSFQIESKTEGISVYSAAQPLRLKSLSFLGKNAETLSSEISIVALNTSLVLLAGVTSPTRSIVLLLWDLQYSVLLASHVFAIPSALSNLPKVSITLRLTAASPPQALLVLSPPATDAAAKSSAARSSIFAVPLTAPKTSTIGNAMGRAAAGAQWLVLPPADETLGSARAQVMEAVRTAMTNNDPKTAEKAFFTWETSERQTGEGSDGETVLGHSFVRDILAAVLQPAKQPATTTYSAALVKHLLKKRVVSASMVEGGLLAALKQRNDWNTIQLCTDTVVDLAESDLMFVLQTVVAHSRAKGAADAMDVDDAIPTLPAFLNACVRYRTAPTTLRVALHQHLTQPEDVLAVLQVLDAWIGRWKDAEVIVLPTKKSVRKDAHGVPVLADDWQKTPDASYPPLIKVLAFTQTLLDASFLALLQHTPAHSVLRRVLARIEPEIQLTEQVDALRGPLEVFARAQAKAVREGKDGKKDSEGGDWRQRRRLAHERAAMAVGGVYQLEELVL